jgi:hypothetical protein
MANFAVGNGPLRIEPLRRVANANAAAQGNGNGFDVQNFDGPDFSKIIPREVRNDPRRLVDYLCFRLYQDPLSPRDTETFVKYVSDHGTDLNDNAMRELLHLMMSTPQYQLT